MRFRAAVAAIGGGPNGEIQRQRRRLSLDGLDQIGISSES